MLDAEDLLIEILLRLPARSLVRFQCVSKHWLFIISSPNFRRTHSRRSAAAVTGLFFAPRTPTGEVNNPLPGLHFVALQDEKPLKELLGGAPPMPIASLSSCKGLVCVGFSDGNGMNSERTFYVYNPTTNQRRRIPHPLKKNRHGHDVISMNIAFDPSKSDHYNLVCVYNLKQHSNRIGFTVFSSESGVWRDSGIQFPNGYFYYNSCGVFFNGGIHWYGSWHYHQQYDFLSFDVDNGGLRTLPCLPPSRKLPALVRYFGEGGGHLHFIEEVLPHSKMLLNVYEMQNDYSEWILKHEVDLSYVAKLYPSLQPPLKIYDEGMNISVSTFRLYLFDGKEGLVMSVPNKLIFCHFHDMSITEIADAHIWPQNFNYLVKIMRHGYLTGKHFETLATV